ncbi:MAG: hypothetical protein KA436_01135 [Oligoflexales bacterium]|nr:hypothetical protein [Oligoflexales bacterium]
MSEGKEIQLGARVQSQGPSLDQVQDPATIETGFAQKIQPKEKKSFSFVSLFLVACIGLTVGVALAMMLLWGLLDPLSYLLPGRHK